MSPLDCLVSMQLLSALVRKSKAVAIPDSLGCCTSRNAWVGAMPAGGTPSQLSGRSYKPTSGEINAMASAVSSASPALPPDSSPLLQALKTSVVSRRGANRFRDFIITCRLVTGINRKAVHRLAWISMADTLQRVRLTAAERSGLCCNNQDRHHNPLF